MPDRETLQRRLLSIKTVITETELSESTIKRAIARGDLEKVMIYGARRITGESYDRFVAGMPPRRRGMHEAAGPNTATS